MSLSSVLKSFAVEFEVTRRGPLAREKGRVVDAGEATKFKAEGGIQPATPKDMQRLPEGQRTNATIAIWTDCLLLTGDSPNTRPDRVVPCSGVYKGVEFEIQSVEPWPSYSKYLAIKVGQ